MNVRSPLTFEEVSWGIEVLLQCPLTTEGSVTRLTVLGHFATIASTL